LENGPREQLAKHLDRLQEYNRITGTAEIARRYLAMNAFDGVLTIIGGHVHRRGGVRSVGRLPHRERRARA